MESKADGGVGGNRSNAPSLEPAGAARVQIISTIWKAGKRLGRFSKCWLYLCRNPASAELGTESSSGASSLQEEGDRTRAGSTGYLGTCKGSGRPTFEEIRKRGKVLVRLAELTNVELQAECKNGEAPVAGPSGRYSVILTSTFKSQEVRRTIAFDDLTALRHFSKILGPTTQNNQIKFNMAGWNCDIKSESAVRDPLNVKGGERIMITSAVKASRGGPASPKNELLDGRPSCALVDDVEEGDYGTEAGASENTQNSSSKPLWNSFFNKAARLSLNERLKHSLVTPILPTVSKLMVYESLKYIYVLGQTVTVSSKKHPRVGYRLMKIDRTDGTRSHDLSEVVTLDSHVYSTKEAQNLLTALLSLHVNRTEFGPLTGPIEAAALVGFVRFLKGYYLVLATERVDIGRIAGHKVYSIGSTTMIPCWKTVEKTRAKPTFMSRLRKGIAKKFKSKAPLEAAESRYQALFSLIDMSKDFYFSYSYELSHSVQTNVDAATAAFGLPVGSVQGMKPNRRFKWNNYFTEELESLGPNATGWAISLLHGYFNQRHCSAFGHKFHITLIARRSRHFAGTRYLKRGATEDGKVGNDVEIEQIIESETGRISSHLQVRGSIPVFWTQETSATNPKPPIVLQRIDPSFEAACLHFADLFERYAEPQIVLNLVRSAANEGKSRRESLVGDLFQAAVDEMNQQLPIELNVRYKPLDFKAMSKSDSKGHFVFDALFALAEQSVQLTGIFAHAYAQSLPELHSKANRAASAAGRVSQDFTNEDAQCPEDSADRIPFSAMRYHMGPISPQNAEVRLSGRRVGTFLLGENGGAQVLSWSC